MRSYTFETSGRQCHLYQEFSDIAVWLNSGIEPLHNGHIHPRQYRLDRRNRILNLLDLDAISQHDLAQPSSPFLLAPLMCAKVLEHDTGTIKDLDALVEHDFLDDSGLSRLSGYRTRSRSFERVDQG